MIPVALALALTCSKPVLVNETNEVWGSIGLKALKTASETCKREYGKCLVKFIKREPGVFWAVCGGNR